jgi:chromosome segregation ATPase
MTAREQLSAKDVEVSIMETKLRSAREECTLHAQRFAELQNKVRLVRRGQFELPLTMPWAADQMVAQDGAATELAQLRQVLENTQAQLSAVQQEESRWRAVAEDAANLAEEAERSRASFENEVTDSFRMQFDDALARYQAVEKQRDAAVAALEALRSQYTDLQSNCNRLSEKVKTLQSDRASHADVEVQLEQLRNRNEIMASEEVRLKHELDALRASVVSESVKVLVSSGVLVARVVKRFSLHPAFGRCKRKLILFVTSW